MSTTRENNKVVFICEDCEKKLETGETNYGEALREFRHEGWSTASVTAGIGHFCQSCKDKSP